ncbi:MAG: hypothetical protein H6727_08875 [Myxococcales bacterium]|nr:hypothetical protein [Myxococcales bacterium]
MTWLVACPLAFAQSQDNSWEVSLPLSARPQVIVYRLASPERIILEVPAKQSRINAIPLSQKPPWLLGLRHEAYQEGRRAMMRWTFWVRGVVRYSLIEGQPWRLRFFHAKFVALPWLARYQRQRGDTLLVEGKPYLATDDASLSAIRSDYRSLWGGWIASFKTWTSQRTYVEKVPLASSKGRERAVRDLWLDLQVLPTKLSRAKGGRAKSPGYRAWVDAFALKALYEKRLQRWKQEQTKELRALRLMRASVLRTFAKHRREMSSKMFSQAPATKSTPLLRSSWIVESEGLDAWVLERPLPTKRARFVETHVWKELRQAYQRRREESAKASVVSMIQRPSPPRRTLPREASPPTRSTSVEPRLVRAPAAPSEPSARGLEEEIQEKARQLRRQRWRRWRLESAQITTRTIGPSYTEVFPRWLDAAVQSASSTPPHLKTMDAVVFRGGWSSFWRRWRIVGRFKRGQGRERKQVRSRVVGRDLRFPPKRRKPKRLARRKRPRVRTLKRRPTLLDVLEQLVPLRRTPPKSRP